MEFREATRKRYGQRKNPASPTVSSAWKHPTPPPARHARVTIERGEDRRVLVQVERSAGRYHAYLDLADRLDAMTRDAEATDDARLAMEHWFEANAQRERDVSSDLVLELPSGSQRLFASIMWRWRSGTDAPEWSVYLHDEPFWYADAHVQSFSTVDVEAAKAAYLAGKIPD